MRDIGFKSCASEPCVFVQNTGKSVTLVVTYVDDLLVMGPDMGEIEVVKKQLKSQLNIRDLGSATEFLGLLVHQGHDGIHIRQSSYAHCIVKKYFPSGHHCQLQPMCMDKNGGVLVGAKGKDQHVEGIGLDQIGAAYSHSEPLSDVETKHFQEVLGSLMHLANVSWPDISHAVRTIAQHTANPCTCDLDAL